MAEKEMDTVKTVNETPNEVSAPELANVSNEKPHKVSDNVCRWLYFFLTLGLLALIVVVQMQHSIITVYQWTFDTDGTRAFIENFSTWFSSGMETGIHAMVAMVIVLLTVAGTIIFIVRFIILLINFFSFLKGKQNREKLHFKFRKSLRQVAKVAGFYLLIDFLFLLVGAGKPQSFLFDLAVIIGMFGLSSLNYVLYETFNREGRFSIVTFIVELVHVAVFAFMGVLIYIYMSKFELLSPFMDAISAMSSGSGAPSQETILTMAYSGAALVFGILGFIFGTNIITKTAYYFPHNDVGKKIKYGLVQGKNLTSAILVLIFFSLIGVTQFLRGTAIMDLIVPVFLIPVVLLAMAICLKVAYAMDNPKPRED